MLTVCQVFRYHFQISYSVTAAVPSLSATNMGVVEGWKREEGYPDSWIHKVPLYVNVWCLY